MKLEKLKKYLEATVDKEKGDDLKIQVVGELSSLLKSFYENMSKDVMIGFFFQNKDLDKIVQAQTGLLMMVMGYEKKYDGVPVSQAHLNMPPIRKGQFHRRIVILEKTLDALRVPAEAKGEWVEFEKQFEEMVVSA